MSQNATFVRPIAISVFSGAALYALVTVFSGYQETVRAAFLLSPFNWCCVLGLTLLHFLLRYMRWQAYLKRLGHRIPWRYNCASYMAGFALTATPGKLGETIRSVYLKPFGVDYSNSLAAFFAERYTDLLAVASLSMLAMAHFHGHLWPIIVAGLAILLALLIVRMPQLPQCIEELQARVRRAKLKSGLGHLAAGLRASSSLLGPVSLLSSYILALLAWSVQAYILYVILVSLGSPIVDYIAVGIFAAGLLAGALSFIPGGLGSTEAVIILLLVRSGVSTPDAVAATLLCRVATLWFAVAVGSASLFAIELKRRGEKAVAVSSSVIFKPASEME